MTINLFAIQKEQRFSAIQIHKYACDYLRDWWIPLRSISGVQSFVENKDLVSRAGSAFLVGLDDEIWHSVVGLKN